MNKLIIANWKTYLKASEAVNLATHILALDNIIIAPSIAHLALVREHVPNLNLAAQDVSSVAGEYGAYTGELLAIMLVDMGVQYAIIGHSERRSSELDSRDAIAEKVRNALAAGITPIICVGEIKEERESGKYLEIIADQLLHLDLKTDAEVVIAYEPTWSVGTGFLPSSDEISEIMRLIRSTLRIAGKLILVYGGSVSAKNAKDIVNIPGVDGVLIGKASTDAVQFKEIMRQIC